jgi:hypothetical protein
MSPKLNVYPSPLLKSMKKERYWRPLLGKRISSFLNKFNESGPRLQGEILSRNGIAHLPCGLAAPAGLPSGRRAFSRRHKVARVVVAVLHSWLELQWKALVFFD